MIGYLKGLIIAKHPPVLLIDVVGVGYEVYASMNTFYKLPEVGKEANLYTHLVVREDVHALYGFYDMRERALFRELIKVNGVGPKVALSILSGIEPNQFVACVRDNDVTRLTTVPGIGKKTAERLIVELRSRLDQWESAAITTTGTSKIDTFQEAISALSALGYKPNEAKRCITQIYKPNYSSEELIRLAVQQMATV